MSQESGKPTKSAVSALRTASKATLGNVLEVFARPKVTVTFFTLLGVVVLSLILLFGFGEHLSLFSQSLITFTLFLALFHELEFVWSALYEPAVCTFNSFLLNQNWPDYQRAIALAYVEFFIEIFLWPSLKTTALARIISWIGIIMVIGGQIIRSIGMMTAGGSFTHQVAEVKRPEHRLITGGIYRYMRHPAYVGWFYWSIGLQMLLANPLCTLLYAYVSYKFFAERIPYEEAYLCSMFPGQYEQYAKKTPVGIPGISGHSLFLRASPPRMKRLSSTNER